MFDAFAQLHLPRRPWLDESAVREAFHRLAAVYHPDKAGGDVGAFSAINRAFEILRSPALRLRHLLELEAQAQLAGSNAVPADLIELFPKIAAIRQRITALQTRRHSAANALARSLLAAENAEIRRAAAEALASVEHSFEATLDELRAIDAQWPNGGGLDLLPEIHARLSYLGKWRDQLREALLQLQLS